MKILNFLIVLFFFGNVNAQEPVTSELYKVLKAKDSLLFDVGFNTCNLSAFESLLSEDLEFYHDVGGTTSSKSQFIQVFKNGICKSSDFVSRRELIEGSLKVYPLMDNGVLYGAIMTGEHRFFEKPKDQPERDGSFATFTHLWLKEDALWKIKRVLSYNHRMLNEPKTIEMLTLSEEQLKPFVGTYRGPTTGLVIISFNKGALEVNAGTMQATIYPSSETVFYHKDAPLTFEFVKTKEGRVVKMKVIENGKLVEEALKDSTKN